MSSSSSSSESEFESPKEKAVAGKGRQLSRMTPAERSAMIEWLDMDREGQKQGQEMKNWRILWGGAAKGRSMQGEVDEVHASGGYAKLANFVNTRCQIKTVKNRAWTSEVAEKRWAWLKKQYKKAARIPKPLNTLYDDDDSFAVAITKHEDAQEKACPDFKKLFAMLEGHPSVVPYNPRDSLMPQTPNSKSSGSYLGEGEAAPMLQRNDTLGVVRRKKGEEQGDSSTRKKQKEEFVLRKPGNESASAKRLNIHEMFIKSQEIQVELDRQKIEIDKKKLMVQAVTDLAKAGIKPEDMSPYLAIMGFAPQAAGAAERWDEDDHEQ
jgi:hypothetical protein